MYLLSRSGKSLAALLLFFNLAGCSKNDSSGTTNNMNNNNPVNVSAGNWVVSSFTQHSENKTSLFNGYVFNMGTGGVLTATNNGAATTGNWSYTAASSGGYYSNPTNASYSFNMGTNDPLKRLNGNWTVSSASASQLNLVNSEPTEEAAMVFSKQ